MAFVSAQGEDEHKPFNRITASTWLLGMHITYDRGTATAPLSFVNSERRALRGVTCKLGVSPFSIGPFEQSSIAIEGETVVNRHLYPIGLQLVALAAAVLLVGCGGGEDQAVASSGTGGRTETPSTPDTGTNPPPVPTYTISGSLSGLTGGKVTLQNNEEDTLRISADGPFTFAKSVPFNSAYAVTVGTPPLWQFCTVANGSGTATANVSNVAVTCAAAKAMVSTLAGSGSSGSIDGVGTGALFNQPYGLATDSRGNVYVADTQNNKIRKITPAGAVTSIAGTGVAGHTDGPLSVATLNKPRGLARDRDGNLYVVEYGNQDIRKISADGVVSTLAGSGTQGANDGVGTAASFNNAAGVAVDEAGNLYVADAANNKIRKVTPSGVVTTLAGSGKAGATDGVGAAASFFGPIGIALGPDGYLYVADMSNNKIRKVSLSGAVTTLAGSGDQGAADGPGADAAFYIPRGLATDADGFVYVADTSNYKIRKVSPQGVVTTLAGTSTSAVNDGIGSSASFTMPWNVTVDSNGNVYVTDSFTHSIRKIAPTP